MAESLQCRTCHIGIVKQTRVTFTEWLGEQLVMLPNCPARQCDVCGELEYDRATVRRVELLLGSQIQQYGKHVKTETEHPTSYDSKQRRAK